MTNEPDWKWYAGADEESYYQYGPFDTREDAIEAATEDGFAVIYVIEAFKDPLKLSDYVHAGNLLEYADECAAAFSPESGDAIFEVSSAQQADLEASIKAAVDAWQERHGLVFTPWIFTGSRDRGYVDLRDREGEA